MAGKGVLGNDPFQRGAAQRTDAPPSPLQPAGVQVLPVVAMPSPPLLPQPAKAAAEGVKAVEKQPAAKKHPAKKEAPAKKQAAKKEAPANKQAAATKQAAAKSQGAKKQATATKQATAKKHPAAEKHPAAKKQPAAQQQPAAPASTSTAVPPPPAPAAAPVRAEQKALPSGLAQTQASLPSLSEPPSLGQALRAAGALVRRAVGLGSGAPSLDVDEFGRDSAFESEVRPLLGFIHDRWFRVESHGFERLPARGPVVLVANRAGTVPWDSAMLAFAASRHGREVRPLVEDAVFHLPTLGVMLSRLGAVRACPENAERILGAGGAVAVFPEGATGSGKPFAERYRLQRFGRGGFVKLALRTGATVVPVAIVGSEEINPILARLPGRLLGLPSIPITPTWPFLGAAGLLPLPVKWSMEIGEPLALGHYGATAASDDALVMRLAEQVRGTIQAMLDTRLSERESVFGG